MTNDEKVELLLSYQEDLRRYLSVFGIARCDFDDVMQDAMYRALKNISQQREEGKLKHWAIVIAKNTAMQYFKEKSKRKQKEISLDKMQNLWANNELNGKEITDAALHHVMKDADPAMILRALSRLKPREEAVMTLYYEKGWNLKQIAQCLGISHVNARVIFFRAKSSLAAYIIEELDD